MNQDKPKARFAEHIPYYGIFDTITEDSKERFEKELLYA